MPDGMTRLVTYTNELEARMAKGRLEALGVTVVLTKDNVGGMRPHLDLQVGVKLHVPDAEVDKARDILAELAATPPGPAWTCDACGEKSEGGFDACWKCGRPRV